MALGLIATIMLVSKANVVHGELERVESNVDGGHVTVFKLSVTPAAEPVPALKHRLMLRDIDLKHGNAASYYYRALLPVAETRKKILDQCGDEYYNWGSTDVPLDQLPLDKVHKAVALWNDSVMKSVRVATQRRECDWEWGIEELHGVDVLTFLLEEIQESRSISRALMLQVRAALAEKRTEDAIDLLRMNYRLARDVAREPLIVSSLVGMAISTLGHIEVIELIAQPGSPNLYWALSELPRPLVDTRSAIRAEMSLGLRMFPFIRDAETEEHSPEEWARLLAKAFIDTSQVFSNSDTHVVPSLDMMTGSRLAVTGMSLHAYPSAKSRLIAGGRDAKQIEAMPVGQVIAIDALREYLRIADDLEKWNYIPYQVMRTWKYSDPLYAHGLPAMITRGYGHALAATVLPAISAARNSEQRLGLQTDGIRAVEAIRMHTAETQRLPSSLDEVTVVPVPDNPLTGKPFEYRLDGDTAVLDLPAINGLPGVAWRFEIRLAE